MNKPDKWALRAWLIAGSRTIGIGLFGGAAFGAVGRVMQIEHMYNWLGNERDVGISLPACVGFMATALAFWFNHKRLERLERRDNGIRLSARLDLPACFFPIREFTRRLHKTSLLFSKLTFSNL